MNFNLLFWIIGGVIIYIWSIGMIWEAFFRNKKIRGGVK